MTGWKEKGWVEVPGEGRRKRKRGNYADRKIGNRVSFVQRRKISSGGSVCGKEVRRGKWRGERREWGRGEGVLLSIKQIKRYEKLQRMKKKKRERFDDFFCLVGGW